MVNFEGFWSTVLSSLKDGIEKHSRDYDVILGEVNTNNLNYPSAHIIPETSNYQDGGRYQDVITVNFYFERNTDGGQDIISNLEDVEETIDDIIIELGKNKYIGEYKVDDVEFLAGEVGKLIDIISVSFFVTKLIDYAEME